MELSADEVLIMQKALRMLMDHMGEESPEGEAAKALLVRSYGVVE